MAQAPFNSPNKDPMSLDEYLKFLQEMDELDLEEPDEIPQCFMCKQECLEVFAKQIKFTTHREFCSAACFKKYTKLKREEVSGIPSPASAPIDIDQTQKLKGKVTVRSNSK